MSDDDMVGEAPPECAIVALHDALAHSSDPLPAVTDSATAFEARLAFADDGAGPVLYHAAKAHVELTANVERFQRALERTHRAAAYYTWWMEQMQLIAGGGPEPTEHRDPITWEPLPNGSMPCFTTPIFTAPEPDAHHLAARVAHGYEDQEAR